MANGQAPEAKVQIRVEHTEGTVLCSRPNNAGPFGTLSRAFNHFSRSCEQKANLRLFCAKSGSLLRTELIFFHSTLTVHSRRPDCHSLALWAPFQAISGRVGHVASSYGRNSPPLSHMKTKCLQHVPNLLNQLGIIGLREFSLMKMKFDSS